MWNLGRRAENRLVGFETSTAKIMLDGVAENGTAALHDPYLVDGCRCGTNRGVSHFTAEVLHALVRALIDEGFALHFHAIGDRAVTDALDAVDQGPRGTSELRHHIAHVQVVRPEDIPRFFELGVTANAQALWACNETQMLDLTAPALGPRRAAWQYPFGSMYRSGVALAMGSDWPVSSFDPWQAIHVAATRCLRDSDALPLNPEEALPLDIALQAYTQGSHHLLGVGGSGVLEQGARADIAIADRNPFSAPAEEIYKTRNIATLFGGRIVFGPT
ncbi:amidohydrolase [Microbacterium sp. AGC62]